MKKCEGHINWFTCEKTTYYRLKQEFCVFFFLVNYIGESLHATLVGM